MIKKHKFKKTKATDQAREDLNSLEDLPLVGGLFKGLGKFIDLAEKVEEAGGEIKRKGEIKGEKGQLRGVYGFSIRTGLGEKPQFQTFGNIKPVQKRAGVKPKFKVAQTREPLVDVFNEEDHVLIIAELPGIAEETIHLNLKGNVLTLEAGNEKRKYAKEVLLPVQVDLERKVRSFKNGILEVKLTKI